MWRRSWWLPVSTPVQMVGAGPPCRPSEEMPVREFRVRDEQVSEPFERLAVRLQRLDARHGQLHVDDGLRGQAGHGCRADVLQPHSHLAQGVRDSRHLRLRLRGPVRVVGDDPDRGVEPVVE
jgi:hypothetical protein